MKPELRDIDSFEYDDLESVDGKTLELVDTYVNAFIGAKGAPGADEFQFHVRVASADEASEMTLPTFVGHTLLLRKWSLDTVRSLIEHACALSDADSWGEVAAKLRRYATYWEFDGLP